MKRIFALTISAACLTLSACGGAPDKKLGALCTELLAGDVEVTEDMARDNVSPAAFCSCYAANVSDMDKAVIANHVDVFQAIIKLRKDMGAGVQEAAEALEDQLQNGTGGHAFTESTFEAVGKSLDRIQDQLEDGGTCQAG